MEETGASARKRGRPRAFHDKLENNTVQSLDKAIFVLKVVAEGRGLALSEVAKQAGYSAPTVYRSLVTLQKHGVVEFDEATQLWRVGVEAFRIGSQFIANTSVVERARPIMQDLMNETGETANLGIISDGEVVFLNQVETHKPIRAFFRPGTRGAIHASGIGKAIFAFMSETELSKLASKMEFSNFTPKTTSDMEGLMQMRNETRLSGFAVDDEERTLGMRCIAAPIFNNFKEVVAALSVSGPTVRVSQQDIARLGTLVRAAADQITSSTGGRQPNEETC